jgi:hypothetical protein
MAACLRDMARNFKTDPTETVALCFGYPKTPCLRAKNSTQWVDSPSKSPKTINTRLPVSNPIMWQFEKVNVPPKLFFLTLFWEFVMFFQLSTSVLYSTCSQTISLGTKIFVLFCWLGLVFITLCLLFLYDFCHSPKKLASVSPLSAFKCYWQCIIW